VSGREAAFLGIPTEKRGLGFRITPRQAGRNLSAHLISKGMSKPQGHGGTVLLWLIGRGSIFGNL
jgi:hypothetical protein